MRRDRTPRGASPASASPPSGACSTGVGAMLPWIRSSVTGLPDELSPTYYGVDLPDGLVVLAGAAVVLGGLAITRLAASPRARRIGACAIIAAAFITFAVAGIAAATADEPVRATAVDEMLAELDPSGTATAAQRSADRGSWPRRGSPPAWPSRWPGPCSDWPAASSCSRGGLARPADRMPTFARRRRRPTDER